MSGQGCISAYVSGNRRNREQQLRRKGSCILQLFGCVPNRLLLGSVYILGKNCSWGTWLVGLYPDGEHSLLKPWQPCPYQWGRQAARVRQGDTGCGLDQKGRSLCRNDTAGYSKSNQVR